MVSLVVGELGLLQSHSLGSKRGPFETLVAAPLFISIRTALLSMQATQLPSRSRVQPSHPEKSMQPRPNTRPTHINRDDVLSRTHSAGIIESPPFSRSPDRTAPNPDPDLWRSDSRRSNQAA